MIMHPSPFAKDDNKRPGEEVTSTSQHQNFDQRPESVRIKMTDLEISRTLKSEKNGRERKKETPPTKERRRRHTNGEIPC